MVLRKEGWLKASGTKGGHMLAKSPSQITMAQVMQALEDTFRHGVSPNPDFCKVIPGCALREVWQKIDARPADTLLYDDRGAGTASSYW